MSSKHPVRTVQLKKGLTRKEAAKAVASKVTKDYRGMEYDPKTGKAKIV